MYAGYEKKAETVPPHGYRTEKVFLPSVFELGRQEFAVQTCDMRDGDALRTLRFAGTRIRTAAEPEFVHLGNHGLGSTQSFDLALRQLGQRRNAGRYEQHGRTVFAGSHAGTATDADVYKRQHDNSSSCEDICSESIRFLITSSLSVFLLITHGFSVTYLCKYKEKIFKSLLQTY